jgi:hypothetical protein
MSRIFHPSGYNESGSVSGFAVVAARTGTSANPSENRQTNEKQSIVVS